MISGKNLAIAAVFIIVAIVAYDIATKKTVRKPHAIESLTKQDHSSWIRYVAPNGLFEVSLPLAPQHLADIGTLPNQTRDIKYDVYLSQGKGGVIFTISTIRYPAAFDITRQEEILEGVKKEMIAANPTNTVLHEEKTKFLSFPAREFSIRNNGFTSKTRAILASDVLYVLSVMARTPEQLDQDFEAFVNSLVIKNNPEQVQQAQ